MRSDTYASIFLARSIRLAFRRELFVLPLKLGLYFRQYVSKKTAEIGTYGSGLTTGGRESSYGFSVNATLTGSLKGIWF